jgi:hypothetical protein
LRKAAIRFMSVRPSAWNNSAPTGRIFTKFDIRFLFFSKIGRGRLQFNYIYITTSVHSCYLTEFLSECFRRKSRRKIETHNFTFIIPPSPQPKIVPFTR